MVAPGPSTEPDAVRRSNLPPSQLRRKLALVGAGLTIADIASAAKVSRQTAWLVFAEKATSSNVASTFERLTGAPWDEPAAA